MDARRFDLLTRALTDGGSRRGLLALLAAIPLVGAVFTAFDLDAVDAKGRRKRRKKRHKHGKGNGRHRKGKKKDTCKAHARAKTCFERCGVVKNNCGKRVDCGSCACDPPCPICQTCQESPGVPGVCVPDPATLGNSCDTCRACDEDGLCSVVANGTACDDGDACTTGDICTAGVCEGTPVVCTPLDQCRVAGVCNPETGHCSNPAKADGTACDDGDACTQNDTCQGGVCTSDEPIVCNACQIAGSCDPETGQCQEDPDKRHTCDGTCSSGEWCDAGACADIQATVTVIDCGSRCSSGTDVATAEICGQMVTCPDCGNCVAQTGCNLNRLMDGPLGPGSYCSTTGRLGGGGQECTSNADCPDGLYCAASSLTCARICPFVA